MVENEKVYRATHRGLSTFLTYALGDDALIDAFKVGERSIEFTFRDDHPEFSCEYLSGLFFSKAGVAVSNCRELLETGRFLNTFANAAKAKEQP